MWTRERMVSRQAVFMSMEIWSYTSWECNYISELILRKKEECRP